MDETTGETEESMEEQAFKHYEKGRDAEDRGDYEEAYKEFQGAMILDVGNKEYKDALERVEKFHKSQYGKQTGDS